MIPFYRLQRATVDSPQTALVIVHRIPQRIGIRDLTAVDLNLVPRTKKGILSLAPGVLARSHSRWKITYAVGSALHSDKRQRFRRYAGSDRTHKVGRTVAWRVLPESHLAEMGKRTVETACGLLILARTDRHLALASRNDPCVCHAFEGSELRTRLLIPIIRRIAGKSLEYIPRMVAAVSLTWAHIREFQLRQWII